MKKKIGLVIPAMALVFGMAVIGCGGGDSGGAPRTSGRLTIIGLDAYDGQYVAALARRASTDRWLLAAAGFSAEGALVDTVRISGGQATLNVWEMGDGITLSYNGHDIITFTVSIFNTPEEPSWGWVGFYGFAAQEYVAVHFLNGVASGKIHVPSVLTDLEDARFNGRFESTRGEVWVFDGTNRAQQRLSIDGNMFTREIRLEGSRFWYRLWDNRFSAWSDVAYSFSEDGNSLTIRYTTFTRQD